MAGWSYQPPSQEVMKKRSEEKPGGSWKGKGYLHNEMYKAYVNREGQNKIRIVPPLEKLEWYGLDVQIHRNIGLNKDIYLCLRGMRLADSCPIDEIQTKELWDEDPDLAKTYYPERRCLIWVMDLLLEDPSKEIFLWSAAAGTVHEFHDVCRDPETGRFIDIMDPKTGIALFYQKEGKGIKTKYSAMQLGKSAIPLTEGILNKRKLFADLLVIPTYEEVKEAMNFSAKPTWQEEKPATKYEPEVEQEEEADAGTKLDGMTRDQLKGFKVQHKTEIKELQFTIQSKWTDDELKKQVLAALAKANRMDLVAADSEAEAEAPSAPATDERDAVIEAKREEVRSRLAAAIAGKKK
jgi:hypothetical protein